jgi:nucleoside-diphosphate-sugar epimerase
MLYRRNYASQDALNSKSRVLITGILNPIGFHLALALKERCGVEVIAGIDPMFPNTVKHRMAMQERIQLLVTNIPKLIQPIVLPLVGLDPRLNKDKKIDQETLAMTGEVSLLNMKPTHIVHLASYSASEYAQGDFVNEDSPYGGHSDMHRIRSNVVATEHILSSLVTARTEQPHFSYASSVTVTANNDEHARCKLADEILADTYYSLNGTFSVGVRLPNAVYGPWGRPGTLVYQMAEAAIGHGPQMHETQELNFDFSYVDDIVDAIIAAMQYRSPKPAVFDLSSGSTHTVETVAKVVANLMPAGTTRLSTIPEEIVTPNQLVDRTRNLLQWEPTTSLVTGLAKTVAWHLDHAYPFGVNNSSVETGDAFRIRMKLSTCSADDVLCHLGPTYMPCVSECSTRDQCTPSIFDSVYDVVRDVTQECDVILYTQSIGYDVSDLNLQATYTDKEETMVCNLAFVPRDSRLVQMVVDKIPGGQLAVFNLHYDPKESARGWKEKRLKALNGRLLYKGWILIWVHDAMEALSESDSSLLKMSPGSFFASDAAHALFVDENFAMSPSREDVLFLISQTRRPKIPNRVVRRKDALGKKHKYRLPAEPERRAAMLLSPMKALQTNTGNAHHVTVIEATKVMQVEKGEDVDAKETQGVKRQREFYERVPTFVNKVDMRSPNEPWYRYELNQWTRSKWVLHDLKLAEGRHLRCDWYQEHVQWGNNLDQLSFAHVLAKRTLARRIAHNEPDDHIKPAYVLHPQLLQLTDGHEWHAMESEGNRYFQIHPMDAIVKLPDHMMDKDEEEGTDEASLGEASDVETNVIPLFVRIISEQVMLLERRSWSAAYAKYKANKKNSNRHKSL